MTRSRMQKWLLGALSLGLGAALCLPAAVAQDTEMGGEDRMDSDDEDSESYQEMLRLSSEGNEHYEAGRFEDAAETYAAAYAAYPQPILLKNQMITSYLIEECEEAIEFGEAFIDTGEGTDSDREDVDAVFGECALELADGAVDAEDWTKAQQWLEFGGPYFEDVGLEEEAAQLRATVDEHGAADQYEVDAIDDVDDAELAMETIAGWSLVTVGVGALTSATIWHIQSQNEVQELEDLARQVEDGEVAQSEFDEAQERANNNYARARWAVPTLYGVGALAAVGGAGLLLWPMIQGDEPSSMALAPQVGRDYSGVVWRLRF